MTDMMYTIEREPDSGTALYRKGTRLMWIARSDPYLAPWFFTPYLLHRYYSAELPSLDAVEFV